mmetsp:Transcript_21126/g.31310  ORF Transcript_21126/g.31310 Transcript_21126/m.31310 type:complete len:218 (+) Transcript_21126:132-785(+)
MDRSTWVHSISLGCNRKNRILHRIHNGRSKTMQTCRWLCRKISSKRMTNFIISIILALKKFHTITLDLLASSFIKDLNLSLSKNTAPIFLVHLLCYLGHPSIQRLVVALGIKPIASTIFNVKRNLRSLDVNCRPMAFLIKQIIVRGSIIDPRTALRWINHLQLLVRKQLKRLLFYYCHATPTLAKTITAPVIITDVIVMPLTRTSSKSVMRYDAAIR